jgi:hypothetical protein
LEIEDYKRKEKKEWKRRGLEKRKNMIGLFVGERVEEKKIRRS